MHTEILQLPHNYPPNLDYTRHVFCYLSGRHTCRQRTPSGYTAHIIRQEQLIHEILFRNLNIFNRGTPWSVQIGHCVYWWPESSVSIVIRLLSGRGQNRAWFLVWVLFCLFEKAFRLFLGPTQPPIEWTQWCLYLGIEWTERNADESPQPPSLVLKVQHNASYLFRMMNYDLNYNIASSR